MSVSTERKRRARKTAQAGEQPQLAVREALEHIYEHFNECQCEIGLACVLTSANIAIADILLTHADWRGANPLYHESDEVEEKLAAVLTGHSVGAIFSALQRVTSIFADRLLAFSCEGITPEDVLMNAYNTFLDRTIEEPPQLVK